MSTEDLRIVPPRGVIYMTAPPIRIYPVSDNELESIRAASSSVSQDFGFMVGAIGVFVTAIGTLATINPYAQPTSLGTVEFSLVSLVSAAWGLYTGWKWLRQRNAVSDIINRILRTGSGGSGTSPPAPNEIQTATA